MTLKQVATTSDHDCAEMPNGISLELTPLDNTSELEAFTSYFELLSQVDQRLQNEDPEYRDKYYSQPSLGEKKNANQ